MITAIGSAIREAQQELGLNQTEFSTLLHVHPSSLNRCTGRGKTPPASRLHHMVDRIATVDPRTAARLADALGLKILTRVPPPAPTSAPRPSPTGAITSALFTTVERLDAKPAVVRAALGSFFARARREGWTLEDIAHALDDLARSSQIE